MAVDKDGPHDLAMRRRSDIEAYYHEDEISLIDLLIVLLKYKTLIIIIMIMSILGGLTFALVKPKIYTYSTSIEIARSASGLIEEPETVLAKLNNSYIDFVLRDFSNNDLSELSGIKITASLPNSSKLIVLESKGTKEMSEVHYKLHEAVIKKLSQDHARMIVVMRRALDAELRHATNKLSELQDEAALLKIQEARLGDTAKLLTSQIANLRNLIDESRKNRKQSVNEVTGEAKAMTLLLIDNEIQQYQKHLSDLEEQLVIGLENDRDEIHKSLANNLRAQDEQRENIEDTNAKISEIRQTQAMTPTMRSLEPEGPGRNEVLVIMGILGLLLGIVAAFTAEFVNNIKTQIQIKKTK